MLTKAFTHTLTFTFLLIFCSISIFAQETAVIKGRVTTADGLPAANVSVRLKGKNHGVLTDSEGDYLIRKIKAGDYILQVSAIGLVGQERKVSVTAGQELVNNFILSESFSQLQEVIVSANKTNKFSRKQSPYVAKMPLKNLENPQVYSSVSKELLSEQLIFSVDDAVKNAPGLQKMWEATGRGGDGGAYYNSRGFIMQSQLRNGIAGNVSSRIDAANLESVEVIKGPSATLFGSTLTSYGGLINRVTKKPFENVGGEVSYSTGSYSFNRISADINSPLNAEKNLLLRVNTAYNYEGSFQDNGFDKSFVIAPSLYYQASDRLSFNLDAELFNGQNTGKQIIFFYFPVSQIGGSTPQELGIDYKRSYSANDITQISRSSNYFGQMSYKFSDKWTSQTNFTSTHSFSDGHYPYFYLLPNAIATGDTTATGSDYLSRNDQSTANSEINVWEIQQNFNGEFRIGNMKNRIVLGLDFFRQNSNQFFYGSSFDVIAKNGTIPTYGNFNKNKLDSVYYSRPYDFTYPVRFKSNTYSAYISDVINVTDRLIALAALRVDYFDNLGTFDQTTATNSGAYHQTAFSPKFGLIFQPVKDKVSLFANYQNGFTNKTGVDYTGKNFKPEQADQIEGGIKLDVFGGKLSSTLSYYDIKVKDVVRNYTGPGAFPNAQIQDGTQLSKGFEAEIIANPFTGLNLVAGFAYNDSRMEKADADIEGRRPGTAMSPYAANLWASYRFHEGILQGLGLGFGGNYASDNMIVNSVSMGVFTLPSYTILNASVFYDQPKYRIGLKMDNITNKQYWIGYGTMNPQKLRSFNASVSFKF
ncbi:TonB-dependent siderophore receptor [Rubrolithibacter danxiaensis]|uniref:TonB-dependent siderophore receptor n=1 Tax=Rubrolithibacter danxiaensis TaxID=3390805 RepID=UPI003BF7A55D